MGNRVAIIGAGISGLAVSRLLTKKGHSPTIYEKENKIGGLIKCSNEDGVLFHRVGGHVFNTKVERVAKWFWALFDENDFLKAKRNAKIWLNNQMVGYPIENFLYQLDKSVSTQIINELLQAREINYSPDNFKDFLLNKFGKTLFDIYFFPYNSKVWKTDLSKVSLPWLEGKLPMPDLHQIILKNIYKESDEEMVHSTFFYPKHGGSSFIASKIGENLNIILNSKISSINRSNYKWEVEGETYDAVIYTGDVRKLFSVLKMENENIKFLLSSLKNLQSNGTSNVLCFVEKTDLSWLYLPEKTTKAHRIIFTGNFSPNNNMDKRLTCTVEFSGILSEEEINQELKKLPFGLIPIAYNSEKNSYVIQGHDTRSKIKKLKENLSSKNFFLLGRFAEWEYYNMDKAIEAAMDLVESNF